MADEFSPRQERNPIMCLGCGGVNAPGSVFCGNPHCHKALGEFKYVLEELRAEAQWHEIVADRVAAFIGKPQFLLIHLLWFALWGAINTGLVVFITRFDEYPFGLLGIILAAEAIIITGFILISSNRQSAHADKRAELDYEVNVRTYREIDEIRAMVQALIERLDGLEAAVREGVQGGSQNAAITTNATIR